MAVTRARRGALLAALVASVATALTACGFSTTDNSPSSTDPFDYPPIGTTLILKSTTNPFFLAMKAGAEQAAAAQNVGLTVVASTGTGDVGTQLDAIAGAIARGDQGILITPDGPDVEAALVGARQAGLYVVALDTPPDDPTAADITFATNNRTAGRLLGEWTAAELDGSRAVIALLGLEETDAPGVDTSREQGFLAGMGIPIYDPDVKGDEDARGAYSGGRYVIAGRGHTDGSRIGGRSAMDEILAGNRDVNVVYAVNDEAAFGALQALRDAEIDDALVLAIDGSCEAVEAVATGAIGADSQQFPVRMAQLGIQAITQVVRSGIPAEPSEGLDFVDTGVALVTDRPHAGVPSIGTDAARETCWAG